jgi:hypothetical protein
MTFEFKASVSQNGHIGIPSEIAGQIPTGVELRVVLMWETTVESDAIRLGNKLREKSYVASATEETVYDSLA